MLGLRKYSRWKMTTRNMDNLPLSKCLEKHEVNAFSQNEIEHFEFCDDDVITSGEMSEDDIVALVNEKKTLYCRFVFRYGGRTRRNRAFNCRCKSSCKRFELFFFFFATENIDEHVVDLFKIVDKKIDELYIKSKAFQPKITSFFNVVD
ncbi:hypothetical protein AVEN_212331-1 [Araneus ventricosus]|uniref:Uncharacterized protein n=1 Tax=Araneus ventricosus TaxID=182803 RepID=A0A4Y2F3G7_ARAVE|nr:hypothetical protein AVEN_212331-1 [Araneus ventricosus]